MRIGLIAHDAKKMLMQNFCIAYRGILSKHELYVIRHGECQCTAAAAF